MIRKRLAYTLTVPTTAVSQILNGFELIEQQYKGTVEYEGSDKQLYRFAADSEAALQKFESDMKKERQWKRPNQKTTNLTN